MILRAAILVLLVLNVGVASWWIAGGNQAPQRRDAKVAVDAPTLRLVREGPTVPATAPAAEPMMAASPTPAAPDSTNIGDAATADQGLCLRFGPFPDAAARDAARPGVASASIQVLSREAPAKSSRGWKVSIPPLATREDAKAMGERIKAAGVTDWYVLNEGADANGIALGRYGNEEAARRRETDLKAKGIPALAEALGNTSPQWWLDARLNPGTNLASLVGIGPSKRIDCATLR